MELYINGTKAELGDSEPAITKKSIDIENPSARFVDITNSFNLPDTQINREIFDCPQGIGTNNRSFDKFYNAVLNDTFQLFKGKGFLNSMTPDKLNFQIVDEAKDLFTLINKKLTEISWDDKDTALTQAQINALDAVDINTCWFWGKACYHKQAFIINTDQTTGDDRCKYSRPSFYVQGLLNRAISQAGYTLTSPLPDLAFSSNHKQFFFTSYQKTFNQTFNPAGTLAITDFTSNDFSHADVTLTTSTIEELHKTKIRIRGNVVTSAAIKLLVHAVDASTTKVTDNEFTLPTNGSFDFTTSEIYNDATGMTIDFSLIGTGSVVFTDTLLYTLIEESTEDLSTNVWLDYKIKAYDNLPDNLTYLDLLKLICVVSNKYPIVDSYNKAISFGSLANLNKNNSVDWSDKFVQQSESVTSKFSGIFQKNYLRYENDITVPFTQGESFFETDNESLASEGDYIKLAFGASTDCVIDSNTIVHVPIYDDTGRIADIDLNIRLLGVSGSCLQFALVDWSYLKETYFSNWFNSLYRIRVIQGEVNLNKLDVLSWTAKQLAHIDYFKTTFIVLEISNFIPGKLTKVKLLAYGR
jgi:hypothetical protein